MIKRTALRTIRWDEPGFSREILKTIANNNPLSCQLRANRLRLSPIHAHILRNGLGATSATITGTEVPDNLKHDYQAVKELIKMFE